MTASPAPVQHLAAIIVAAGRGTRAGGDLPKQWQRLAGRRVIDWTLDAFRKIPDVEQLLVVTHPDDADQIADLTDVRCVPGGDTRAASVRAGLEALTDDKITHVLIHDAARACVDTQVIASVIDALVSAPAAAPGAPVTDTLWRTEADEISGTVDRDGLYRAQTPQGFYYPAILAAHRAHDGTATDDVGVARAAGIPVTLTKGDPDNLKITTAGDFARAERILKGTMITDIRTGNGFDVHRFGPGDHVILCGVRIPHNRGLQGHSDADVGLHTITDALYGALAEGDIGRHFPPSEAKWKGADSRIFLEHAVALARERGYVLSNIDCTLICEVPKIGPHAPEMTTTLAEITGIARDRISVKATTSERLGFTGRGEGIAALATVTLVGQ
ncbi:MAG: bifunctional 2-C-methyl-D-erythritol 4-phosphate cytidylyltransferase/2-C-methyl-D-erythritol 2,4-cyclodiphosphate synthase [Pseudomonadota bacterium]